MKFYKNLYIGETIRNPDKIKRKLRHGARTLNLYVITLAAGNDQLEIFHCAFLRQSYYKKNPPFIIAISSTYEEAVDIVVNITKQTVAKNGNADIKYYLFQTTD